MKRLLAAFLVVLSIASICGAREIVITSTADSGTGTLRWALEMAQSGDAITFDPAVFPPGDPAVIYPLSELPSIGRPQSRITIDASNAGVIIDGANVPGDSANGLQIYTDDCVVMGLQIMNFASCGITACGGSRNTIGGDRSVGAGPIGQGNLLSSNGIGVDLCGGGIDNVITGNIIGTDASLQAVLGNHVFGISIEDGVSRTIIGPNNILAHNRIGIDVAGARATSNTITENVFLKTDSSVINLREGANGQLAAPFIAFVDPPAGRVGGTACPNCTVQIYTFTEKGLSAFEGTVEADDLGEFVLTKGAPLNGNTAVATATDTKGNTSELSAMMGAVARIQEENSSLPFPLAAFASGQLEDNRIGSMSFGLGDGWDPELFPELVLDTTIVLDLGLKRFRLAINSLDPPKIDWSKPECLIDPIPDAFITALRENGTTLTYVLSFWDKAWVEEGHELRIPRFKTEEEIQRYLDLVQFIVRHFRDRIEYFEIWNEPSGADSITWIEVEDYIRLVRRVVPVIRQEYPEAKIVVGGTHSLIDPWSHDYLLTVLRSDIMPLVDVVSWHGMYGPSPEYEFHRQYYYDYPSIIREIRSLASQHGFTGEYVADELQWATPDQWQPTHDEPCPNVYSEIKSAKYCARGITMNLGMDASVSQLLLWGKPKWYQTLQNLCSVMAGHEAIDMPVGIDINWAGPVAYCSFRYPNGDRMLAVWTDGIAQDEDSGVPATITFPGLTAETVTGIDVLHGFEQELVFEIDGDDTIIRDLLVKDYPILIRLSDVTMSEEYEETVGDGFHQLGDIDAVSSSAGGSEASGC